MLKELIKHSDAATMQRHVRWRNIYFSKSGKTHLGSELLGSQAEAESLAQGVIDDIKELTTRRVIGVFTSMSPPLLTTDYAWHMQFPITEEP